MTAPPTAYITIDGRRWRTSDPRIPESFRQELVNELMAARRAVRSATSPIDIRRSRQRVNDAKVALGERGHPWWLPPEPPATHQRIEAAMRSLLRSRGPGGPVFASNVARIVDGTKWRTLLPTVRACAVEMNRRGELEMLSRGRVVSSAPDRGVLRYRLPPQP